MQKSSAAKRSLYMKGRSDTTFGDQIPGRYGCCTSNHFRLNASPRNNLVVALFDEFQKEHSPETKPNFGPGCEYHSDQGCTIRKFRTPTCIGYICPPYAEHLMGTYSIEYQELLVRAVLEMILTGKRSTSDIEGFVSGVQAATFRIANHKEGTQYNTILKIV